MWIGLSREISLQIDVKITKSLRFFWTWFFYIYFQKIVAFKQKIYLEMILLYLFIY